MCGFDEIRQSKQQLSLCSRKKYLAWIKTVMRLSIASLQAPFYNKIGICGCICVWLERQNIVRSFLNWISRGSPFPSFDLNLLYTTPLKSLNIQPARKIENEKESTYNLLSSWMLFFQSKLKSIDICSPDKVTKCFL